MARIKTASVSGYLKQLPAGRRSIISAVRGVILKNLPKGYRESLNWGMIAYEIPLERYPVTYNGQPLMYAALASQKNYCALYLMNVYGNKELANWFKAEFKKAGKKFDMGKSCVRFRNLDDLPLDVIGKVIASTPVAKYIERYEALKKK